MNLIKLFGVAMIVSGLLWVAGASHTSTIATPPPDRVTGTFIEPTGKYKLPPDVQKGYDHLMAHPPTEISDSAEPVQAPAASSIPVVQLRVAVGFDGRSFYIANGMDFDLLDTTITIERGVFSDSWTSGVGRIKKHYGIPVAAVNFQKSNGSLFNPFRDEASYARVVARNNAGTVFRSKLVAIRAVR